MPEGPAGGAPFAPQPPVYAAPQGTDPFGASAALTDSGKKRPGAGLIIGGIVAVVLVAALAVAAFSGLFASPRDQLANALAKTAAAYADAQEGLDLPDLSEFLRYESFSRRISLALDSFGPEVTAYYPELASLKGLGLRLDTDFDRADRKMDADMALFWDDEDLLSFQLLVDDGEMYLASPDFTGGDAYGFNTETLGADLIKLGAEDDEGDIRDISFNLFDLPDPSVYGTMQNSETTDAHFEAWQQMLDAIEVKKGGKETIDVNGWDVDATVYHVLVPRDAMQNFINSMADVMETMDGSASMKGMLEAIGLDGSTVQEIISDTDDVDLYGEQADNLRQLADVIGDVELEVYVSGGYISAVEYSDRLDGTEVEVSLYLGGGDNYVDDRSLTVRAGSQKVTIESTGNHGATGGVFTDETTIRMNNTRFTSVLRYEPKADDGNFEWELKVDNTISLAMEGQLTLDESFMDLRLDEISFKAGGSRLLSLKGSFYAGPCDGMQVSFSSPKLLAEMSEGELLGLYFDIMNNAEAWTSGVLDRIPPELSDYLY